MCSRSTLVMKRHVTAEMLGVSLLAAILCVTVAEECPKLGNDSTLIVKSTVKNIVCTWNLKNASYVLLEEFSLKSGDFLIIYDGTNKTENIIANLTGKHDNLMVYSDSVNNTIVFTSKAKPEKQVSLKFKLKYSPTAIQQTFTGTSGQIQAPIFKPGRSSGRVVGIYKLNLSSVDRVVMSLSADTVNITNGSLVVTDGGNKTKTLLNKTGNFNHFGDVFSPKQSMLVTLNMPTALQQNFSAAFTTTTAGCSMNITIDKRKIIKSPAYPKNYRPDLNCRWVIQSPPNTTIRVNFLNFSLADSYDHVIIVDGNAKEDRPFGVYNKLSPPGDDIFLTSGNSLWLHFGTDESLSAAGFKLTVEPLDYGGRFVDKGVISVAPSDDVQSLKSVYFQLTVQSNQQVFLNFNEMQLKNSTATVTCYNSLREDSAAIIARFSNVSEAKLLPVISSHNVMLVVASNFFLNDSRTQIMPHFNASFSGVPQDGLQQISLGPSGVYQLKTSVYPTKAVWHLPNLDSQGKTTGVVALKIDSLVLRAGGRLTIYGGTRNRDLKVAQFTHSSTNVPVIYVPSARVVYTTIKTYSTNTSMVLVKASYSVLSGCGGNLSLPSGVVTTPQYPNQYPFNADCMWRLPALTSKLVHVTFTDLMLVANHSVQVLAVNQTSHATKVLATYSSNASVPTTDLVVKNTDELRFRFQSAARKGGKVTVGQGFQASYENLQCGGLLSSGGQVKTPNFPKFVKANTTCVWIISLPASTGKKPRVVAFKYQVMPVLQNSSSNMIEIRDGASSLSQALPVSMDAFKKQQYSRTTQLWIRYTFHKTKKVQQGFTFNLTYQAYDCVDVCDNGWCMPSEWKCNNITECIDGSDEKNCLPPQPTPAPSSTHSGVSVGWFVAMIFIMFFAGIGVAFLIPIAYRRFRAVRYRELRDMMSPSSA